MEKLTLESFENIIKSNNKPIFVYFLTNWSGSCKLLQEYLKKYETNGKYTQIEINSEISNDIVIKYNITTVPTILIFENCNEINRLTGFSKYDVDQLFN